MKTLQIQKRIDASAKKLASVIEAAGGIPLPEAALADVASVIKAHHDDGKQHDWRSAFAATEFFAGAMARAALGDDRRWWKYDGMSGCGEDAMRRRCDKPRVLDKAETLACAAIGDLATMHGQTMFAGPEVPVQEQPPVQDPVGDAGWSPVGDPWFYDGDEPCYEPWPHEYGADDVRDEVAELNRLLDDAVHDYDELWAECKGDGYVMGHVSGRECYNGFARVYIQNELGGAYTESIIVPVACDQRVRSTAVRHIQTAMGIIFGTEHVSVELYKVGPGDRMIPHDREVLHALQNGKPTPKHGWPLCEICTAAADVYEPAEVFDQQIWVA